MGMFDFILKPIQNLIGEVLGFLTGQDFDDQNQASGVLVNKQSNIDAIPVIYGRRKVGGVRAFISTGGGSSNEFLYMAIVLSEGQIDAIEEIYVNDVLHTDSKYSGLITVDTTKLGSDSQTYSTLLAGADSTWGVNHRLRGVAYLAIRIKYDQDVFGGIPDIQCVVRGRRVYDPRTDTTAYSNNPALCLRDYLTNPRYGKGLSTSLINNASFIAAANTLDTLVTSYSGGGNQKLLECNAVIDTGKTLFDNVKIMLQGMRGLMPYSNGIYSLLIDKDETSTFTLTPDNITSKLSVASSGKDKKYNKVTVKYVNPDANWQSDAAIYPEAGSTEETNFLLEDNGEELAREVTMNTITNPYSAKDMARIICLASRENTLTTKVTATSEALAIAVGDVVTLQHPSMGWTGAAQKQFRVIAMQMLDIGEVDLTLQEYNATIYPWVVSGEVAIPPETSLPDPFTVAPPSALTLASSTYLQDDGRVVPSIDISWTAASDAFVSLYEVQWKRQADTAYQSATTSQTSYQVVVLREGITYDVRVRSINSLGARSAFVSSTFGVQGDTTPPSVPQGLTAVGGLRQITISWVAPSETDYSHVEVYENTVNTFGTATKIAIASGDSYTRTGLGYDETRFYWVKAVDYSGNPSAQSASATATTLFVGSDAFSEEVTNLFSEAGAYGIEPVATLPATGDFNGQIKYDTTANKLYRWDATAGVWTDDIFSISEATVDLDSFAAGIEPVGIVTALPNPTGYTGAQIVFNTTDNKLYRYTGTEWIASVPAADVVGTFDADNFPNNLRPVEIVGALPTTGNFEGRVVYLTTDNKLYRYDGTSFKSSVSTTDLEGAIQSVQIADDAVTNAKIAVNAIQGDVIAAGAITAEKLPNSVITTAKLANSAITNAKIAVDAIQGDVIAAGAITAEKILDGAISTLKLADDSVNNAKIAVDAIQGDVIAAGAITAEKLLDGAVSSLKLTDNAVTNSKIAVDAIQSNVIKAGSITAEKILDGAVSSLKLANQAVTNSKIAVNAIQGDVIAAGAISSQKIADSAINSAKLANQAVTNAKIGLNAIQGDVIAAGAITNTKISDSAISTPKLQAGSVTTSVLAAGSVQANNIASNAITTEKLQAGAITADKVAANTLTAAQIKSGTITSSEIAAGTIVASNIASGGITADRIQANSLTSSQIQAGGIVASSIAANTLTASQIAAGTLTSAQIQAGGIVASSIAAGTLTATQIASNAITTAKLAAGSVSTAKLQAGSVTTSTIAAGAITAEKILANSITASQIASNTLTASQIAAGAITASELATNAVTSSKILAGNITTEKLAAGSITAEKIQSAAITTEKLAAGSVVANSIASNAITSDKVSAGAITTNKLLVVAKGAAINSDPNAQDSTAWARFSGAAATFETITDGEVGNNVIRSGGTPWSWYNGAERIALDPSKTYRMTALARRSADADGRLYVGVAAFTAAGANISGDGTQWSYGAATNVTGSTDWTRYSMEFGAGTARPLPATGVTFAPLLILNYQNTAGYYEAQDIRIEEKIPAELVVDGAITTDKLSANAVTAAKIAANTITAAQIAAGAITTTQLSAGSVSTEKLQASSVTASQIASGAITTAKLAAGAVTAEKILANSITAGQLAAGSVSTSELASNAVTADKILAGSVTTAALAAGAVTAEKILSNSITAGQIAAGAIATSELATGAVIAEKIQFGTITGDRIKASTIQGDRIAANTITGGLIAATGIITSSAQINDGLITNAKIANLAVTEAKIASAAVTNAKIGNLAVDTIKIANQAVTFPESSFAQSALTKNSGVTSEQTIRSLSVSSTGAPTEVFASFTIDSTYNLTATHTVRIKRGATVLASCVISVGSADQYPFAAAITDPDTSSGSRVYSLTIQGFGSWSITNRYIRSLELKK